MGPVIGHGPDLDDIAQESIVRLMQARRNGARVENDTAFALRVAVRLAMDWRRAAATSTRHRENIARYQATTAVQPISEIETAEDVGRLYDVIGALPPMQAAAVSLRHLAQLDYGEISNVLGCSRDACRAHVCQALRRLRVLLADLLEDQTDEIE